MPTFSYTARDRQGKPVSGTLIGSDPDAIREMLRAQDLFLTYATVEDDSADATADGGPRRLNRRVRAVDMVVFSRQLATLVRAGLPIIECLLTVSQQTENQQLFAAIQQVRGDILAGSNFADALSRHPKVFSELFVALVRAGEAGGLLAETLETAAEQLDKESELREKVKTAFAYPAFVLVVTFLVVSFLVIVVIPRFAEIYASFRAKLPPITLLLVQISHLVFSPVFDLLVLATAVLIGIALSAAARTPRGRRRLDRLKLGLWLFGPLYRKVAIARLTYALSAMLHSGVPILQALTISARVANNIVFSDAMLRVADFVQQGARLWMPLEQTGQFPPMVIRMIAAGEESGSLDLMLSEVARYYQRDVDYSVQKLTRFIEPVLTIVVGGIVLFVLLALYLPVFNLTTVIRSHH
jgi:type IV pilus assembly protein PilC